MDGDELDGLFWVFLAVFLIIGLVVGLGLALVAFVVFRVVRPRPGLRFVTAVVSFLTAGFALLAGQLVRLALVGSITDKACGGFPSPLPALPRASLSSAGSPSRAAV
jgi:hypothetical protein